MKRGWTYGWAAAACVLLAAPAYGQSDGISTSDARKRMDQVDVVISSMRTDLSNVSEGYKTPLRREGGRLQRRLREAEIQALLEDHYRAAIVLFDVAERPELRADPQYPNAIFLLAESLRKAGFPRIARTYYEQLAPAASGRRLAEVVLGILEVASTTGNFSGVEANVARLRASGAAGPAPRVDFAFAKALFRGAESDVMRLTRALALFRSIPSNQSVSAPAAYYAGVTLVRQGRLEEAVREFERAQTLANSHPNTARILELTALSLGRLHQELGQVSSALDAYQAVSKDSPFFAEMLYEVAWVHVKAAEEAEGAEAQRASFGRALDATQLLTAAAPTSRLYPDAKVLQGNLQIRLGAPETAYDTFQAIVDEYGGARAELEALIASRKDARAFFEDLIETDLERLDNSSLVPPIVAEFALNDDRVATAVEVRKELAQAEDDIRGSRELVKTLEAALGSEQRFGMFPGLRVARLKALSVQNRLLGSEQALFQVEREAMVPYLDASSLARVDAIRVRAREVEEDIASLPTSDAGIEGNRELLKDAYQQVQLRAFTQITQLRNMRAQLVAVRLWMRDQGVVLAPEKKKLNDERMARASAEIEALDVAIEGVRTEIERAALLSRGDGGWARAERLRKELYSALDDQARLLKPKRGALPGELRGVMARVDQQRQTLRGLERDLSRLQTRLEQDVDARVDEVRRRVLDELRAVNEQRTEYQRLAGSAEQLLGPIAEQTVETVGSEFSGLVRKADVGILDVAWARKRERSEEVTELVQELQRRSSELDTEFEDVLEDD